MKRISAMAIVALLAALLLAGCREEAPVEDNSAEAEQGDVAELKETIAVLKERVERLEVAQAKLAERLADAPEQPLVIQTDGDAVDLAQIEEMITSKVRQSVDSVGGSRLATIAQQEIKAYEEEQQRAQEAEREARRQEWEQRRQQREVDTVANIAGELSLDQRQTEELLIAREGLRTTIREVFEYMREQGSFDRDTMRTTMTDLQGEHRKILEGFMSQEQVEQYLEKYSFNPAGGRPWGGNRR
jgi:PBP1b-binding outer membrane lipoprotein LpoB